jgi:hypothetical protein
LHKDGIDYKYKFDEEDRARIMNIAMIKVNMEPGRKLHGHNSYFNFITAETLKILKEYLAWRKRHGDPCDSDAILIGNQKPKQCSQPVQIIPMGHHWNQILKENGFDKLEGQKWHPLHLHTLRKFHYSVTEDVKSYAYKWRGQK